MESFDALTLARIRFAFTVSAHTIFPAFSIGLPRECECRGGCH